jgi:hypothetical protein
MEEKRVDGGGGRSIVDLTLNTHTKYIEVKIKERR